MIDTYRRQMLTAMKYILPPEKNQKFEEFIRNASDEEILAIVAECSRAYKNTERSDEEILAEAEKLRYELRMREAKINAKK